MEHSYTLLINWNPRHFEIEGITSNKDIESIKDIAELYADDKFVWDTIEFEISMDWSQLVSILIESEDETGRFYKEINGQLYKQMSPIGEISIPIRISTNNDQEEMALRAYLHRYILDLFIVCNLSAPGLIDFYNAKLDGDDDHTPIKLSNFSFGNALQNVEKNRVPFVDYVDVRQCFTWFRSLEINTKVVASTSVEKALFSILHMVRMDDYDISTVPWIFHALEAIYGTNAGRGFTDISEKVNFLLSVEERQRKSLKKRLRELNDLRSSFIHGGYNVSHIMDHNSNDKIFETINFGMSLVISSLQCLMRNNWHGLSVKTEIVGLPEIAS